MKAIYQLIAIYSIYFGFTALSFGGPPENVIATKRATLENKDRASIGLRLIDAKWHLYSVEFSEENWKTLKTDPFWTKKIHRLENGKIQWEEDYYYTGRKVATRDGETEELVTIHYDYSSLMMQIGYVGTDTRLKKLIQDSRMTTGTASEVYPFVEQAAKTLGLKIPPGP